MDTIYPYFYRGNEVNFVERGNIKKIRELVYRKSEVPSSKTAGNLYRLIEAGLFTLKKTFW
jgi:hypothetical protein